MTREEAERELCRLLEEAEADIQAGRTVPAEEVFAQLRALPAETAPAAA